MSIVDFVCWVAVIALVCTFFLALARKWGWLEWLQIHAPNEFLYKLFSCSFCLSWWTAVAVSLALLAITGRWEFLLIPPVTTSITTHLL